MAVLYMRVRQRDVMQRIGAVKRLGVNFPLTTSLRPSYATKLWFPAIPHTTFYLSKALVLASGKVAEASRRRPQCQAPVAQS